MGFNVEHKDEKVQGQGQETRVRETVVRLDEPVLDPNSDLAVQVPPEGTSVHETSPIAATFVDAEYPEGEVVERPLAPVSQPEVPRAHTEVDTEAVVKEVEQQEEQAEEPAPRQRRQRQSEDKPSE